MSSGDAILEKLVSYFHRELQQTECIGDGGSILSDPCAQFALTDLKLFCETLESLSLRILDEVPGVVSVTYNIAPKPPSTMEAV